MINFLPIMYEDEMLYSVMARYQRMCGMISKVALINDLFDRRVTSNSIFFPKHINALVNNLPPTSKITTNQIIKNHTMFPFYSAFLTEKKANQIASKMANGNGTAIETYFGIVGSKIKIGNYLRYCPICFEEDYKTLGESYWRRSHQIVGTLYCIKHKVLLKDSSVLNNGEKLGYICADESMCATDIEPDPYSQKVKKLNLIYIKNANCLLKMKFPRKSLSLIIAIYIDLLREQGYASKSGFLYLNKIQSEFLEHYSNEYLEVMQSSINPKWQKNWLRTFVWNNNANKSPLRHLLYLQFLGVSVQEFFSINSATGRIRVTTNFSPQFDIEERRKQWLDVIEKNKGSSRSQLKEIGKGLHTWIYRHDREWYEKVTPERKAIKPRKSTVDWKKRDEECLELAKEAVEIILNMPGKPIRITPSSITRVAGEKSGFRRSEGLVNTRKYMKRASEDLNDFRIRKIKWAIEEMEKKKEYITLNKIRVYIGFNKKDDEIDNLIEKELNNYGNNLTTIKRKGVSKINWEKRDMEFLELAKTAYESMLNEKGKPRKITISSMLQTMIVQHWLFKPELMKRTNKYLHEVKEDINEFRIRKIKWAIEDMKKKNLSITPYKVQIYAGFGGNGKSVREMIEMELLNIK